MDFILKNLPIDSLLAPIVGSIYLTVSNYLYCDYVVSLTTLSVQLHILYMQHATNCAAKCIHPNTLKLKQAFLVLAWHGLY